MYLVQDIVLNHTGDFFHYAGGWNPQHPEQHWQPNAGSRPTPRPTQWPFNLNDPRDPAQRRAGIYHWTPDVQDYADRQQELTFQMAGLDDLNTENPVVRRALRKSYGDWIRRVGVDAFRVDTAFYVPPDLFTDFLHARDRDAPGVKRVAQQTGRKDFLVFGEGFGIDGPGQTRQSQRLKDYMAPGRMDGMLNFPLYGALGDAFARGRPTQELADRIRQQVAFFPQLHSMPSFVDNHDVDRFLAGGNTAGLRQALLAIMTLPGIPTIYYGTEQGFTEPRAAMFAAGVGSGGHDHFDTQSPLYRDIAAMTRLRREHRLFSRGTPQVLRGQAHGPGALAWRTQYDGQSALVVFNTADQTVLLDSLSTGLPAGQALKGAYGLDGAPADTQVDSQGQLTLRLPARAAWVWVAQGGHAALPASAAAAAPAIDPLPAGPLPDTLPLSGNNPGGTARLQLVLDGQLALAAPVDTDALGHWHTTLDLSALADDVQPHRLVAWRGSDGVASAAVDLLVQRDWREVAQVSDPADDDHGPTGHYQRPTDPPYQAGSLDLRQVQVRRAGRALQISATLGSLSQAWNPQNGFDHLALTVFISLPGQPGGSRVMPLQHDELPDGMVWHRRLRVHGWSNAAFSAEGASAHNEGTPLSPAAALSVDPTQHRITLTLPAALLGGGDLSGAKVLLTTWDWDGGYRPLASQATAIQVGAPDMTGPLWMDRSAVITLP
jgi:glycosidase